MKDEIEIRQMISKLKEANKVHEEYLKKTGITFRYIVESIRDNKLKIKTLEWVLCNSEIEKEMVKDSAATRVHHQL